MVVKIPCTNINHRREDAPVHCCPMCGDVVNPKRRTIKCTQQEHLIALENQYHYCVDCGQAILDNGLQEGTRGGG
ncbi:MAG: YgiT-type zinc finger protein [Deltaproteobacteria bacterium]|nr:YgiT-type zinc finger protein [Deltaproteobacteria bacterium]